MSLNIRTTRVSAWAACVPLALAMALAPAVRAQSGPPTVSLKDHPGWVQVPGALVRPDCVYEVPNEARVEDNGDIVVNGALWAHYEDCPEAPVLTRPMRRVAPVFSDAPGTINGWVEAVQEEVSLSAGDNIDKISGTWTVPDAPSVPTALIYLFNGLEPTTENLIVQPVLQYGATSAGGLIGGNYWVIASWLVGKNAYHSPGEKVDPGDTISGDTYIASVSGSTINWKIKAKDVTTGAWSTLSKATTGDTWNWAFSGVLEVYGVSSCSELPAGSSTAFNSTVVNHGYPSFKSVPSTWSGAIYSTGGLSCGFAATPGAPNILSY